MRRKIKTAKVLRVDLDEPLQPLEVDPHYSEVLLVVLSRGRVVGQVALDALSVIPVDLQRAAIGRQLGDALWRQELEDRFLRAVGAETGVTGQPQPVVSVVVCTRDRPDDLERCLESLSRLEPAPHEILVVDNCPATDATSALCGRYPVKYLREELPGQARARNRGIGEATGDVIAFTDDDCVVDPAWLSGLGREFADPRVGAVLGIIAPLELEAPAQCLFEAHGGFGRGFERRVVDGVRVQPALAAGTIGAGANSIFRRAVFERVGLFAEWLGPGTPARAADDYEMFCRILEAGDEIVLDTGQLVWHRHRSTMVALRRVLFDYGVSSSALATQRVVLDRDPGAVRILGWWWFHHIPADILAWMRRRPNRVPLRFTLAEFSGTVLGPWSLWRSRRSRRAIDPIELAADQTVGARPLVLPGCETSSLSVVIPSCDRREALQRLLEGLSRQPYPAERFEAIVVLDGTSDDSAEMVRTLDLPYRLELREIPKSGVAAARNVGVSVASEPIVVFLDDDVAPEPSCLAAHALAHATGDVDLALGYSPPAVDESWWSLEVRAWWEEHFRRKAEPGHRWTYVDFVTVNSSIPRVRILEHGGFDETFCARHEDWELGVRLLARGARFGYFPDTIAHHRLDLSLESMIRRQREEASGDILLARKQPSVGSQLPLAAFDTGRPFVDERRLAQLPARAARLERLGLKGRWRRVVGRLLRDAYALGLRAEVPSEGDFLDLVAGLRGQAPARVDVPLDGGALPTIPFVGSIEFALTVDDRVAARIAACDPFTHPQIDWRSLQTRVRATSDQLRSAVVHQRLVREVDGGVEAAELRISSVS